MVNIVGSTAPDFLTATGPGDRLFGLQGDDTLRSDFGDTLMNGGSGDDRLQQNVTLDDVFEYADTSFFKAGSGDDRVVLRNTLDLTDSPALSDFSQVEIDQTIQTESGDDFVFVDNRINASVSPFTGFGVSASIATQLVDLIGDNQIILRNTLFTLEGSQGVVTDVELGGGDDVVRYEGETIDFSSFIQSSHSFDLGDGDNRFVFNDESGDLDFDLTSGSGRDVINIDSFISDLNTIGLRGTYDISTGGGDDVVMFEVNVFDGPSNTADTSIDLGDGDNFLRLTQNTPGVVDVDAGDGNDRLLLVVDTSVPFFEASSDTVVDVDLGDGDNHATVAFTISEPFAEFDFSIRSGDGNDRVDYDADINLTGSFEGLPDRFGGQIDTGGGNDRINLNFADVMLTTGDGADIVRFDQSAITERPVDSGDPSIELNPGHNTVVLTDFDFEAGDRFIFTGFDTVTTLRSVDDLSLMVDSGEAVGLANVGGDLLLDVENDAGEIATIIFEGLGDFENPGDLTLL